MGAQRDGETCDNFDQQSWSESISSFTWTKRRPYLAMRSMSAPEKLAVRFLSPNRKSTGEKEGKQLSESQARSTTVAPYTHDQNAVHTAANIEDVRT